MMLSRMDSASSRSSRSRRGGIATHLRQLEVGRDAGQQLAGAERLGEVVVGPRLQPLDPRLLARPGRRSRIGIAAVAGSARSSRSRPKPSSIGIITSVRTRSGGWSLDGGQRLHPVGDRRDVVTLGEQPARRTRACRRCRRPGGSAAARRPARIAEAASWRERPAWSRAGPRRAVRAGQPAERLLDVRRRPQRRRRQGARATDPVGRQVGRARRDRHGEGRPAPSCSRPPPARRAAGPAPAPAPGRSPSPRACAPGALDAMEPLEEPGQLVGRDARPGVLDPQRDQRPLPARSDTAIRPSSVNLNALERRFRTIFSHMSRST